MPPQAPLPPRGPRAPSRLGQYEVIRRLGASASSEVILAVSRGPLGFERTVVLKRLQADVTTDDDVADGTARLAREALAYARLAHPAIVRLFDFVEDDGRLTLVLEHVDGLSLARILTGLRALGDDLDEASVWYVGYRVFLALAAAHSARDPMTREFAPVIHRDVSPGNVLVPWDGYAKLGDFGVARLAGVPGDTRPGVVKGTVGYLAPEQVRGEPPTVRTDVYAACLLVRELLLRSPVFPRENRSEMELLAAMAAPDLVPLAALRPALPVHLSGALDRGLSPDSEARDVSAEEMVLLLRSVVDMEVARVRLAEKIARLRRREDASARSVMYATRPDADAALSEESVTQLLDDVTEVGPTYARLRDSQEAITSRPPAPSRSLSPPPLPERATRSTRPPPVTSMVVPRARAVDLLTTTLPSVSTPTPMRTSSPPSSPPSTRTAILTIAPPPSTTRMLDAPRRTSVVPPRRTTPPPSARELRAAREGFASRTSSAMIFETPNVMTTAVAPELPETRKRRSSPRGGALLLLAAAIAVGVGVVIGGALGLRERMNALAETTDAKASAKSEAKGNTKTEANTKAAANTKTEANTKITNAAPPVKPPSPAPVPKVAAPRPASSPAAAAPSASTGRLITAPAELGHRIFVDGRFAGGGGAPLTVRCGRHDVRVGSAGRLRTVEIPCGGELEVSR